MNSTLPIQSATRQAALNTIDVALVHGCVTAIGAGLRAVILTGSVARGEASLVGAEDRWTMLGDVEGVVILDDAQPLLSGPEIVRLCEQVRQELAVQGIDTEISLAVVHGDFLRKQPAHIFSYELRHCGRVLWGEAEILRKIPEYSSSDLSREDAWRMLSNRIIELLEYAVEHVNGGEQSSFALQYRVTKLYLDMATSLLVFLKAYRPTYAARSETLALLSEQGHANLPFSMREFAARVRYCTEYKLSPDGRAIPQDFIHDAASYACQIWRWELEQMTGIAGDAAEQVRTLARKNSPARRVRGWMFVARHEHWLKSWNHWFRWIRIALHYTPRYAIYLAGFEVFCALSESLADSGTHAVTCVSSTVSRLVPVPAQKGVYGGLAQLSHDVLANYKQFVRDTRA